MFKFLLVMEANFAAMDLSESVHDEDIGSEDTDTDAEKDWSSDSESDSEEEDEEMEEQAVEEDIVASASEDESESESECTEKPQNNKKKRGCKDKWLKDIKKYQATTELLIPRLSFSRLVREVAQDYKSDLRFTEEAFEAIQTAAEAYLIDLFSNTNKITIAKGNDTITPADMQVVRDIIKSMMGWINVWY